MARPRNWERLSAPYQRRLERAGISRSDYMAGQSLRRARGHANTPERPSAKPREGNEQYYVNRIVERHFGDRIKYKGPLDLRDLPSDIQPPTVEQIEYALELDTAELEALINDPEWWWLRYH